jgi:hypothetical protein
MRTLTSRKPKATQILRRCRGLGSTGGGSWTRSLSSPEEGLGQGLRCHHVRKNDGQSTSCPLLLNCA